MLYTGVCARLCFRKRAFALEMAWRAKESNHAVLPTKINRGKVSCVPVSKQEKAAPAYDEDGCTTSINMENNEQNGMDSARK